MSGLVIRVLIIIGVFGLWAWIARCELFPPAHFRVDAGQDPVTVPDAGVHGSFGRPDPHGP